MAKKFLCVEVSDRVVKVSVATGTEKSRKVKDAFHFETPEDSVLDGTIMEPQRFAQSLTRELANHKCEDVKDVFFTIASSKVATREVKMPATVTTDQKIETMVENNRSDYFPMDVTNYKIKFRVMSREKKGPDKGANVLIIAMPNSMIAACANTANSAQLRIRGVDTVCSSMVEAVTPLKQNNITAFVNVEATNTNMLFMKGNELLLQRTLSFGGEEMVMAYQDASESSVSYLEALDDLSNINAEDNIKDKLDDEDITSLLERVVGSITRSVDYFNTNKGGGVTQLVLMGTCGNMLGLEDLVDQATGITTVQMSQLPAAATLRSIAPLPAYYMSCMYAGGTKLNFGSDLDDKKTKSKGKGLDLPTTVLIFLLMIVFAAYWAYSVILQKAELVKQLEALQKEVEAMVYLDDLSARHTAYKDSKESLTNFTTMTFNPNENLLEFLAELEAKMPREVLVLSATATQTSVSLNFVVNSLVEAATVISKLRSFETIGLVQVSGLGITNIQFEGEGYSQQMLDGFEEVTFSAVCTYGLNPYTNYINPYATVLGIPAVPNIPVTTTPSDPSVPYDPDAAGQEVVEGEENVATGEEGATGEGTTTPEGEQTPATTEATPTT